MAAAAATGTLQDDTALQRLYAHQAGVAAASSRTRYMAGVAAARGQPTTAVGGARSSRHGALYNQHGRRVQGVTDTLSRVSSAQKKRIADFLRPSVRHVRLGGFAKHELGHDAIARLPSAVPSTLARGSMVHHQLAHRLQCVPARRCICPQAGMRPLPLDEPVPSGPAGRMIVAGMRFVYDEQLAPLGCELAVASNTPTVLLGTRVDALFCSLRAADAEHYVDAAGTPRTRPGKVLVSWKTSRAPCDNDVVQLGLELHMLAQSGIACRRAYIVYLRVHHGRTDCVVHAQRYDERACRAVAALPLIN